MIPTPNTSPFTYPVFPHYFPHYFPDYEPQPYVPPPPRGRWVWVPDAPPQPNWDSFTWDYFFC